MEASEKLLKILARRLVDSLASLIFFVGKWWTIFLVCLTHLSLVSTCELYRRYLAFLVARRSSDRVSLNSRCLSLLEPKSDLLSILASFGLSSGG